MGLPEIVFAVQSTAKYDVICFINFSHLKLHLWDSYVENRNRKCAACEF